MNHVVQPWIANAHETRHTVHHETQSTALSGGTSSQLPIDSMNTKISPISDFTSRLINRLSLTPLPALAGGYLCVHTPGWAGNTALCPLLSSNMSSDGSYANHQMPKDKYNSFSALGVGFVFFPVDRRAWLWWVIKKKSRKLDQQTKSN